MLALPITTKSAQVLLDVDRAPTRTPVSLKMVVPLCERPSSPTVFTSTAMTPTRPQTASQKRPKLSLQTSSLPLTFGKSSTALSIATSTLPPASPTVLNTFNNAYDVTHRFSPATASPTGARCSRPSSRLVSPFALSKDDRPYQVSLGLKGILRNSPIPSGLRRSSFCPASESPRTGRRAFFLAAKKVTFRVVLEEEIHTTTYTAKHSDLSSDEEDSGSGDRSDTSSSSSDESDADDPASVTADTQSNTQPKKKRKAGSDRQIQAAAIRDCVGDAGTIQKRLKPAFELRRKRRRRHWEWTLEPLKETSPQAETVVQPGTSPLSPSQIPLPPSAGPDRGEAARSPSPSKTPLPESATLAPFVDGFAAPDGRGDSVSPSPASLTVGTNAAGETVKVAGGSDTK